jgi:hypothetical protein
MAGRQAGKQAIHAAMLTHHHYSYYFCFFICCCGVITGLVSNWWRSSPPPWLGAQLVGRPWLVWELQHKIRTELLRLGPCGREVTLDLFPLAKENAMTCHGCASVHHGSCFQHSGIKHSGFGKWGVCWWWCSVFGMAIVVRASSRSICFCVGGIVYSQSGSAWWVQVASPCLVPRNSGCGAASHTGSSRHCHPCGLLHSLHSHMSRWAT